MIPSTLLGIAILLIAIYIGFKLFKNILKIGIFLLLILIGSYLLFGGIPTDMSSLSQPSSGQLTQGQNGTLQPQQDQLPEGSRIKDIIVAAKDIAWGIEIVAAQWDSDGTLLVAVTNTGQLTISGIKVWVNGEEVDITNTAPTSLEKGDTAILDTNYMAKGQVAIRVRAGQAEDEISANP